MTEWLRVINPPIQITSFHPKTLWSYSHLHDQRKMHAIIRGFYPGSTTMTRTRTMPGSPSSRKFTQEIFRLWQIEPPINSTVSRQKIRLARVENYVMLSSIHDDFGGEREPMLFQTLWNSQFCQRIALIVIRLLKIVSFETATNNAAQRHTFPLVLFSSSLPLRSCYHVNFIFEFKTVHLLWLLFYKKIHLEWICVNRSHRSTRSFKL